MSNNEKNPNIYENNSKVPNPNNNGNPNIYENTQNNMNGNASMENTGKKADLPSYNDVLNTSYMQPQPAQPLYPQLNVPYQQQQIPQGSPIPNYAPPPPQGGSPIPGYAPMPPQPAQPMYQNLGAPTGPIDSKVPYQQPPPNNGPVQYAIVVEGQNVLRQPMKMMCPYCNKMVDTTIEYEANGIVWILALILFLFSCILFFLPFCFDEIKDVVHYCPICQHEIARMKKFE